MYNKSNYDHIFYRMKKTIPKSSILYIIVTVIKVYPMFFLSHSAGYMNEKTNYYDIHSFYKYFTLTYYLGTMPSSSILIISITILIINLLLICLFIIYLSISTKVQQIDQNYGDISSLGIIFFIFSNFAFFKYIILFQFFNEINFFPIICLGKISETSINNNQIFSESYKTTVEGVCNGGNKIIFYTISLLNIIIDIVFNWILTSRFFDLNILSDYVWNFSSKFILSFEFLESYSQIFFNIFLFFDNKTFLISYSIYIGVIFLLNLFEKTQMNFFSTPKNYNLVIIRDFVAHLSYIGTAFILLFMIINNTYPNDLSIVILLIMEIVISLIIYKIQHNNDSDLAKKLLVEPLSNLTEKNIYPVLTFTLKEFLKFNDLNQKFDDENLDIFLYNYVDHLKICDDLNCPCKGSLKKGNAQGGLTTFKSSGGHTNLNLVVKKDGENEYILNTFFNVLSSNLNTSIVKLTKGTNVNLGGKETNRQKIMFQLRVKLIFAVKKLLSHKLEKLVKHIDSNISSGFSSITKDYIRINFYSFSILCNNAYYKTQFYYYEYINDIFRKKRMMEELQHKNTKIKKSNIYGYEFSYIYYLYLRMFAIQKYNGFMAMNKMNKKEGKGSQNNIRLDFTKMLSLCVKYYEIEDRLMKTAVNFEEFIQYFIQEKIIFNDLINIIETFMKNFKGMTNYIVHYFKNDKINNLFICSKIILLFKVINFQIPDEIYNKLTSQIHDLKDARSGNELDSNYYMILNYINGEFIIKYLSHELLILLEYNENDLKNKDFHILMPQKIQKFHKQRMITEIKGKNTSWNNKRIFFNTNSSHCILFDLQYKFLLNLRGEITILAVLFPVNNSKETRNCFVCIDDSGEILALNKEFEDYFFLNMHMLNLVKIDVEKLILQGMAPRMRTFFKDVSNVEFQEQFDYELYLQHLFGEEFDVLKENNDKDFQKKYLRCELLKESNKRGKYFTPYIEVNIKQRILGKQYLYFVNFSARVNLNKGFDYIAGSANNQLLIDTINNSMKEMAKMTILKNDIMMNSSVKSKKRKKENNEQNGIVNDEEEELIENENIGTESSLEIISADSGPNKKELFNANSNNNFNIFSKNQFIVLLIVTIAFLILISLFLTCFGLAFKINISQGLMDIFYLEINSILLQNHIFFICEAIINLGLIKDKIIYNYKIDSKQNLAKESIELLNSQIDLFDQASYSISYYTSKYYNKEISYYLEFKSDGIQQIFQNGYIYINTNTTLFDEISKFKKKALESYNFFYGIKDSLISGNIDSNIINSITYDYFLLDYISDQTVQNDIHTFKLLLNLNEQEIILFYILKNSIPDFILYNENLINEFYNILKGKQGSTLIKIGIYKLAELFILILTIVIEWIFIYFGFKKFKNKIFNLRLKVEKNHIDIILQKIEEYKKFSNGLNIESIYYISDMEYKNIPILQNYDEDMLIHSMIGTPTPKGDNEYNEGSVNNSKMGSSRNLNKQESINQEKGGEGKKNIWKMMQKLDQIKTGELNSGYDSGLIEEMNDYDKINKKPSKFMQEKNKEEEKNKDEDKSKDEDKKKDEEKSKDEEKNKDKDKYIDEKKEKENNDNNNNNINNEKEDKDLPIIGVLRNNNDNKEEEDKEDDSKMNIIKKDEGLGLGIKKKNRITLVQFKEKDIRYYSPGQGVNEITQHPGFTEGMNESYNTNNNFNNGNASNKNKYKNYLPNSLSNKNKGVSNISKYTPGDQDTIRALNKKEPDDDFGSNDKKGLRMNIGRAYKNEMISKEEIEKKIINMIHSNLGAKVILNTAVFLFCAIFIISFIYNCLLNSKLEKARNFTYYYYQKSSVMNEIILDYQLHLIKNFHDENTQDENKKLKLNDLEDNYKSNSDKIISFTNENNVNTILKETSSLIGITSGKYFCENFAKIYLEYFPNKGINTTDLEEECLTIGEKININGYTDAESYSFTTLSVFIEDWKNIYNFKHIMDKESIKSKLNENKFINIIEETIFTTSKFSDVLQICLFNDFNRIFKDIKLLEVIFGVISIVLEIGFFIISLLLIIYPIRSVDLIINWFSKRYGQL